MKGADSQSKEKLDEERALVDECLTTVLSSKKEQADKDAAFKMGMCV